MQDITPIPSSGLTGKESVDELIVLFHAKAATLKVLANATQDDSEYKAAYLAQKRNPTSRNVANWNEVLDRTYKEDDIEQIIFAEYKTIGLKIKTHIPNWPIAANTLSFKSLISLAVMAGGAWAMGLFDKKANNEVV